MIENHSVTDERVICRFDVDAAWLGPRPRCVLTTQRVVLREPSTGAEARVAIADICDISSVGGTVRIRTSLGTAWADFAGRVFDGWYEVSFHDRQQQAEFITRLRRAMEQGGRRPITRRVREFVQKPPPPRDLASWLRRDRRDSR